MAVLFKKGNKFWATYAQYRVTASELKSFEDSKTKNPIEPYGGRDYKYKGGGVLGQSGFSHARLRNDLYIVYRVHGKDPTIILEYGFVNHEDSGTGNPPKPAKQHEFAKKLNTATFERKNNS